MRKIISTIFFVVLFLGIPSFARACDCPLVIVNEWACDYVPYDCEKCGYDCSDEYGKPYYCCSMQYCGKTPTNCGNRSRWVCSCTKETETYCGPGYYACNRDCCEIDKSTPDPTNTPDDDDDDDATPVPSCSVSLSGSKTLSGKTPDTVTATINSATNMTVSSVQFVASDPTVAGIVPAAVSAYPFTATLTPKKDGTTTVTAYVIGAGGTPCQASYALTVLTRTYSVTGHVYASEDLLCDGTTDAASLGYTGGTMVMSANATSGYAGSSQTGVKSSATFTVPGNATTGYDYTLGFANDDTNWVMQCPLPSNYSLSVKDLPIEKYFFVTQMVEPWWQVAGGDAAAPGNIVQKIPGAATKMMGSVATATMDSGAFIAGNTIDTNNVSVGATTNWKVTHSTYHSSTKEGYSYFMRVAEMGVAPKDDFTPGQAITLAHNDLIKDPTNAVVDGDRKGLYHQGDVTIGDAATPIVIAANDKPIILFVNGNVVIDGNITVAKGGYFAVIAKGNITFSGNSYNAHGQYVADGILKVQDAATGNGITRQFTGEGNFIGWQGVTLERSLKPAADPLANNMNPAELFTYRPDFITNTPITLKHGSIEWQEVAPRQLQ